MARSYLWPQGLRSCDADRLPGDWRGSTTLLLNGYAASAADWDPAFLDELAKGSRVICPDHRGIAGSLPLNGELTVRGMAQDALELMDAEGIEIADVAGWSMGGFVAQQLAAGAPERVRNLALLGTDPGGPGATLADPATWAALIDHSGTPREQATRILGLIFPPGLGAQIDAQFGELVAVARAALSHETLDAQSAAIDAWHAAPAEDRLGRITAPTLIAAGTQDVVIPFTNSTLLANSLPGCPAQGFHGCGHAFMAQEPVRLGELINEWIGRS